jgi:DNA-binding CsgD family transcriptional regulator
VHDIFSRLGAEGELAKARGMFREIGAKPPARPAASGAEGLTGRELEIARMVAARKSNKAIGRTLDISPRTVSTHLSNIFRKLELDSRGELADYVREHGL